MLVGDRFEPLSKLLSGLRGGQPEAPSQHEGNGPECQRERDEDDCRHEVKSPPATLKHQRLFIAQSWRWLLQDFVNYGSNVPAAT
jgi:hypothetical protein